MSILALDLGTSSVRATVYDDQAAPIPGRLARRKVAPHQGEDGRGEQDPDDYVASVIACLDDLSEAGALDDDITGVAMSSQWHSVLALDAATGDPRGRALTWLDTRAQAGQAPADPVAFHERTGSWVHSLYWTAKIPWLRGNHGPGGMRFVGLPDYIRQLLLGDDTTSVSIASGTGLLDLNACDWDDEALELAGTHRQELPAIVDEPGHLLPRFKDRWPALADVPWYPAIGDGAASNLGSGCADATTVAVTVGTSLALRVVHEDPIPLPWEVWRYRVDSKRYVSGIAFSGGGVLHAWGAGLLGLDKHYEPTGVRPGRSGLVVVPLHAGSRPPGVQPPGSGMVLGLSLDTSPEEFMAGTMDGVSLAAATALDTLDTMVRGAEGRPLEVVLGGGAAHGSAWWRCSLAAAFERSVRIVDNPEVGACGAAALALGILPAAEGETVQPDGEDIRALHAIRGRFDELRALLEQTRKTQ